MPQQHVSAGIQAMHLHTPTRATTKRVLWGLSILSSRLTTMVTSSGVFVTVLVWSMPVEPIISWCRDTLGYMLPQYLSFISIIPSHWPTLLTTMIYNLPLLNFIIPPSRAFPLNCQVWCWLSQEIPKTLKNLEDRGHKIPSYTFAKYPLAYTRHWQPSFAQS